MPDQPTVACILLTKDRPQMARRAVARFRAQTYERKRLLVFDTSGDYVRPFDISLKTCDNEMLYQQLPVPQTIGGMRNAAIAALLPSDADIIAHLDDDDLSHANRLTEQVALLQASGADVVGYRECLFWRELECNCNVPPFEGSGQHAPRCPCLGEAWLYSNPDPRYCIGSSLMYWRTAWERQPFNENLHPTGRGEDHEFWRVLKSVGVGSIPRLQTGVITNELEPRMICSIHAGNAQHYPSDVLESSKSWKRVPEWDNWCRKAMTL